MTFFRFQPYTRFRELPVTPAREVETWQPPADVFETAAHYVVRLDVPGVDPKDIELSTEDGILTLKGVRQDATGDDRGVFARRELPRGEFDRGFRLPKNVDVARINARGKNGVLEIFIPKLEQSTARTIKVDG